MANSKALSVASVGELAAEIASQQSSGIGDELVGLGKYGPVGSHSDGASISSATTLTPPAGATGLIIQALGQNVRVTIDGTTPTATTGFQLLAGGVPRLIPVGTGTVIKVIQEAATADLQYQWIS